MPNHVFNEITFDKKHADIVFSHCCPNGEFDFETLVPMPINVYRGGWLVGVDSEDFLLEQDWCSENWGTRYEAFDCSIDSTKDNALIFFSTPWSVPYKIITAFANRFQIDFTHKYLDEMECFWGIDTWGRVAWLPNSNLIKRLEKRYMLDEDLEQIKKDFSENKYFARNQ